MCFIIKMTIVTHIFVILKTEVVMSANCSTIRQDVPTFRDCEYRCHCKNDVQCAEDTGTCENGCAFGWMGPACQYRNFVKYYIDTGLYVDTTKQTASGNEAVDGDSKTCTQINITVGSGQQYWYLQFNKSYEVVGLIIKVPDDDVENNRTFWIETGDGLDQADFPTLCYHQTNNPMYPVKEIMCLQQTTVQQLRIRVNITDAPLSLCEVEIYGGRSIAFNKPTCQKTIRNSYRAVDGMDNSCTYTQSIVDPWWRVNLETQYVLHEVHFGAYMYNIREVNLLLGSNETSFIDIYHDTCTTSSHIQPNNQIIIQIKPPATGQYLQVQLQYLTALMICEVVVFAECPRNKCGLDCSKKCFCTTDITGTLQQEGQCPYGCQGRWTGVDGKCDQVCPDFKYGLQCASDCGICKKNTPCNVTDGTCVDGCQLGWKPPTCHQRLPDFKNRINPAWKSPDHERITPSYSVGKVAGVAGSCGAVIVGLMVIIIILVYRQHTSFRREQRLFMSYTPGNSCGESDGQVAGRFPEDVQTDR